MPGQDIPVIGFLLNKLIGSRNDRFVKRYLQRVEQINRFEPEIRKLDDAGIRTRTIDLRKRYDSGTKGDELMVEAFAVAREAMDRGVGIRNIFNPKANFDVSRLKPAMRDLYAKIKAEMDALEPLPPTGPYLGNTEPIPGWRHVDIPNELYEAVRELYPESRPPFRARPFDVQLIGGMVLTQGKIAEMRTGEGKTIVAPLAAYFASIQRNKVHVVTVNDYLVQRDRDWTAPYFRALGLTVGAIHPIHQQDEDLKRQMYKCDVVYGTTSEFGFDFLRDNMKREHAQQVQRKRHFAIVDEVDSTLIDEARTPLIISGPAHEDQPRYELADKLARHLLEKQRPWQEADKAVQECISRIRGLEGDIRQALDKTKIPELQARLKEARAQLPGLESARARHVQFYEVKPERKSCHLTHEGVAEAQRAASIGSFYVDQNMDLPHLLEQSIRAHAVYQLDRDYVVMNVPDNFSGRPVPSIVIVDTNTGRPMIGRQWSDGLHQAIECKERVPIKQETQTVATVTIQNFFKMYKKLAGMTGTADTEAQEFHDIYKLDVVAIPTNRPMIRRDMQDLVYLVAKDKWQGIVDEIKQFNDVGRPILVGTTSVEKSEMLSQMLTRKHGVQHEVLNAKQHEREAHIVENAGQLGAVMIATNMAGRGTDIKLGGFTREQLLEHWLRRGIAPRTLSVDASEEQLREQVYRKIAPQELGVNKREIENAPIAELELELLRAWAVKYTFLEQRQIERASAEELREALDARGRCLLHRIRWFEGIEDMGGLHVIGTERHEARRIDNQLRGRAGRQGDKGSSRFYVAMDDELMKLFAGEAMNRWLARFGMKECIAIEHPWLSKSVENAQRKVEERNFQIRKNLLEYDEIMEHQRQSFYGLRQRVIEGRDVKGLLFEYVKKSVQDAAAEYLDPEYPLTCAAEYAQQKLDVSFQADRLRGKERDEIASFIRREAKYEARHNIGLTLGEYMPMEGSEVSVDFDSQGLINWAKSRFGVEIDPAELRGGGASERNRVLEMLVAAAEAKIDEADLSGIERFLAPTFGAEQLADWVKKKLVLEITAEEISAVQAAASKAEQDEETAPSPTNLIMQKAIALYRQREYAFPVDYAMEMTMQLSRQSRAEAANQLVAWANRRYKLGWTPETLRSSTPQKVRQDLLAASQKFVDEDELPKLIDQALACDTDEKLEAMMKDRFSLPLPEDMKHLEGEERQDAIRSRIETIMRAELLHFERTILLETLDGAWKDHLYAMDQLRDSIGFRAFSQQDPRIEFKREGSLLFRQMWDTIRDRVTDYIFKARISPLAQAIERTEGMAPPPRRIQRGPITSLAGPGFDRRGAAPGEPSGSAIAGPLPTGGAPAAPGISLPGQGPAPQGQAQRQGPGTPGQQPPSDGMLA
ncbi:MAG: preprotein translocase subunit SecA [Planctomycetota bacterium]|nr:preprotein translocase subunit SecA [Planctomycetota bacterium]